MKNIMSYMYYCMCITYKKRQVNKKIVHDWKAQAKMMKEKYPRSEDWYYIRFSNVVYFGYGLQDKLQCISKSDEQYCPDYIQENKKPNKKDKKHYHY